MLKIIEMVLFNSLVVWVIFDVGGVCHDFGVFSFGDEVAKHEKY